MALVGDMFSVFKTGRILGSTTYVVVEDDIKARRPRDVFFIVLSMIFYMSSLVVLHVYVFTYSQLDTKAAIFSFTRVALVFLCFFVDVTLTTVWNSKIRLVLSQLRNFDRATKFHDPAKRVKVRNICRGTVFLTLTYWTIVGYLSYRVENRLPIVHGLAYIVIDAAVCTQVLMFVCLAFLIRARFRLLCDMLTFSTGELTFEIYTVGDHSTLQQVRWLHSSLVNATETLNSAYSVQLSLWILSFTINAMSRIYTLNEYNASSYRRLRESMLAIVCSWNLVLITVVCHSLARQANRVGEIIFAPSSSASTRRVFLQENLEAAAYFQLRKVHFFIVAGFLRVDLPLLLSIVSSMTTYLVILR
ncbi:uncharacterized protein LOC143149925 [Ptiloglossa arizonensis]|uniref:uncharacterized protein LOC143149925 n=1 Tax=Ptiloglossa arizonensis TaxID=3350558 RepID=UPI003FA0BBFF